MTYVYDDVTYAYDDVTCVYDDVTYVLGTRHTHGLVTLRIRMCQKRPSIVSKETYLSGRRGLPRNNEHRHTSATHVSKET